METIMQNQDKFIWKRISTYAFYLGVLIEVMIVILDKSAYIIRYEGWWFRITFLLFTIKVCFTKYSKKEYGYTILFLLLGVISYLATGRNEIIRMTIFVIACKDIDMRMVLRGIFWVTLIGCSVLILLSLTNIYGIQSITTDFGRGMVQTRYCFGLGHPNALHCMFFVLMMLGIYIYHEKWKWKGYVIVTILNILVYLLTDSRAAMIMGMGFIVAACVLQYGKRLQNEKWCYLATIGLLIFAVVFSILLATYNTDIAIFERMDSFLTGRICSLRDNARNEGMIETWSIFSTPINNYYFDLGIVRLFYWYGWIPAIFYLIMHAKLIWASYKYKDYMMLAVIISYIMYTIVEAHFISVYIGRNYILFFMGMYLAGLTGTSDNDKEEYFFRIYRFLQKK